MRKKGSCLEKEIMQGTMRLVTTCACKPEVFQQKTCKTPMPRSWELTALLSQIVTSEYQHRNNFFAQLMPKEIRHQIYLILDVIIIIKIIINAPYWLLLNHCLSVWYITDYISISLHAAYVRTGCYFSYTEHNQMCFTYNKKLKKIKSVSRRCKQCSTNSSTQMASSIQRCQHEKLSYDQCPRLRASYKPAGYRKAF